ncbi:DUF2805 domain-containing protein [Alphaproteobacteria bacterium]|nr:DUF2805 domain-containing protein [Alphaproteobacteria bacterium]
MSHIHRLINYFTQDDMIQIADMAMNNNITFEQIRIKFKINKEELNAIMEFICDREYYDFWKKNSIKLKSFKKNYNKQ